MATMDGMDENGNISFWKTLPGVLTAFAAVIGAIATLLTTLYTTGLLSRNTERRPLPSQVVSNDRETPLPSVEEGLTILAGQFHEPQWKKRGGGDTFFANGELSISTKKGDDLLLHMDGINPLENMSYAVTSRIISVNGKVGSGQLFWYRDPNNYYYFHTQPRGYFRLVRVENGVPETLVPLTSYDRIKGINKKKEFKIITNGRKIGLYVDNIQLVQIRVDKKSAGRIGYYTGPGLSLDLIGIRLMDITN